MSGEKAAGKRGIMGSVAKPAQARAVHILTRVPPSEVQGRNVLRWDCQKMSFAALPEPFGVELVFDGEGMRAEPTELPESFGETKTERAVRAMQSFLETQHGQQVGRKELLDVAIKVANVRERAAKEALKMLLERLGEAVAIVKLPGQGQPLAYRLKTEHEAVEPETPTIVAPRAPNAPKTPPETAESLGQSPTPENSAMHQTSSTPAEITKIYERFRAGKFKGQAMKLPVGQTDDLSKVLEGYFSKKRLTETERHDLLSVAKLVLERETAAA